MLGKVKKEGRAAFGIKEKPRRWRGYAGVGRASSGVVATLVMSATSGPNRLFDQTSEAREVGQAAANVPSRSKSRAFLKR
jgi:hypothetical protein